MVSIGPGVGSAAELGLTSETGAGVLEMNEVSETMIGGQGEGRHGCSAEVSAHGEDGVS